MKELLEQNRDKSIHVRLTAKELEFIQLECKKMKITPSKFIRLLIASCMQNKK